YGYALALLRAREYAAARTQAQALVREAPDNMFYRTLQAEIELAAGRRDAGLALYARAYAREPGYYPLAVNYARALLAAQRARQAEPILRDALKRRPDDPVLYQLLSQASGALGNHAEAHRAMAEHYYLNGNAGAAIEQLELARRRAGDNYYLQASIDARLQAIRQELATLSPRE